MILRVPVLARAGREGNAMILGSRGSLRLSHRVGDTGYRRQRITQALPLRRGDRRAQEPVEPRLPYSYYTLYSYCIPVLGVPAIIDRAAVLYLLVESVE